MKDLIVFVLSKIISKLQKLLGYFLKEKHARTFSNLELKKVGKYLKGEVINVSGWKDSDKRGGLYQDYFPDKTGYTISNFKGERGVESSSDIFLDLTADLPPELAGKYEVVFNHTVLEHISQLHKAVENICKLTNDALVLVVPFKQDIHFIEGSFEDYWRFTPFALRDLLKPHGLQLVYVSMNNNPVFPVYCFAVAARKPEKYRELSKLADPYWQKLLGLEIP